MNKITERLGTAPLGSLILKLSLPGIAATVAGSIYNIVDTFWVAKLGHEAIAALTIIFPFQVLTMAIGIGTGAGMSALVSRKFGEKNVSEANHAAGQVFFLSAVWGLFFLLAAFFLADRMLPLFGATPDIIAFSRTYLLIISCGAPANIFVFLVGNLLRGSGEAVKPTIILIIASFTNIVLDPFMILGIGPFPEMGVKGAALATVLAQIVGVIISLFFLLGNRTAFRFTLKSIIPGWSILKQIYHVGAPASIQQITESLAFVLFNKIVSGYGSIPIAAIGLTMRLADLFFMPVIGVANALLPVVGFNFGARNEKRIWDAVRISSTGIALLLLVFTAVLEIWTPNIVSIFVNDPEVLSVTITGMRIMLSTLIFIGPTILFITAFQGLSMGGMSLFLSLIRQFLLFIPMLFLLQHLFGLIGIWIVMPVSDILSFIIVLLFLLREYKKRKASLIN